MKNTVLAISYMMIGILTIGMIMMINGKMVREEELRNQLSSAVEETVENVMLHNNYQITDKNEFLADFVQTLLVSMDTDSDVTVYIQKADMQMGILSVKVEESFRQINGKVGSVSCEKTVVFDKLKTEEKQQYAVQFYYTKEDMEQGKTPYKVFQIQEGDKLELPKNPEMEGDTFSGWRDENGHEVNIISEISGDRKLYARW